MRPVFAQALLFGALLAGCGAPRQSDANPAITSVFEPVAPLVDYSVPPPRPALRRPTQRGSIATLVDSDGDRLPSEWKLDEMISGVLHASWRDHPEELTARILAWQVVVDERPLYLEEAILWIHFTPPVEAEFFRLDHVYRHPRETTPHLKGWHRSHTASPHTPWTGAATYEERPDNATVIRFFHASAWDVAFPGFVLIDGAICAGAWKRSTGEAPGFAYP